MGSWFPCCNPPCERCPCWSQAPSFVKVLIAGVGNGTCTGCSVINGITAYFVRDGSRGRDCLWNLCHAGFAFACDDGTPDPANPAMTIQWDPTSGHLFLNAGLASFGRYEFTTWECSRGTATLVSQPPDGHCTWPPSLTMEIDDGAHCPVYYPSVPSGCCPDIGLPIAPSLTFTDSGVCPQLDGRSIVLPIYGVGSNAAIWYHEEVQTCSTGPDHDEHYDMLKLAVYCINLEDPGDTPVWQWILFMDESIYGWQFGVSATCDPFYVQFNLDPPIGLPCSECPNAPRIATFTE